MVRYTWNNERIVLSLSLLLSFFHVCHFAFIFLLVLILLVTIIIIAVLLFPPYKYLPPLPLVFIF